MRPELHPICAAFPRMAEKEMQQLADDIKVNGLIEAITMLDGMILDGRNRWDACEIAGVDPRTINYEGNDPIRFVVAKNERRRHLSYEERAFIAASLANLRNGSNQHEKKVGMSVDIATSASPYLVVEAARDHQVSEPAVMRARRIQRHAPALVDMVKARKVKLSTAALAVANSRPDERASWTTPDDVRRAGIDARRNTEGKPAHRPAKTAPKRSNGGVSLMSRPHVVFTSLSDEDRGAPPPDASLEEKMAHDVKYGRVQLFPKGVKELLECRRIAKVAAHSVTVVAGPMLPGAEQFSDCLEQMAAWIPQPERGNGFEIDFARAAREIKAQLRRDLPVAIERLTAMLARL